MVDTCPQKPLGKWRRMRQRYQARVDSAEDMYCGKILSDKRASKPHQDMIGRRSSCRLEADWVSLTTRRRC